MTDQDIVEIDSGFEKGELASCVGGRGDEGFLGLLDLPEDLLTF
jgi:hypothetical protein